jgi:O-antigen/teichoic acid export membrane protein
MLGYDVRNVYRSINASSDISGSAIPKKFPRPRWDRATMTRLFWLTLPLGFVTMLISFNLNIPRYFIEGYLGSYQLGIFAAITAFQKAAPTVVQALGRSAAPRLSKYFAAGKASAFRSLSIKLIGMGILLGMAGVFVAWLAGDKILALFYGPEYALTSVFILVMVASGTDYLATILLFIITSARNFKIQLPLHLATTATVAVGCYFLVPSQGLIGAALALILADIVRLGGTLGAAVYSFGTLRKVSVNLTGQPQLNNPG